MVKKTSAILTAFLCGFLLSGCAANDFFEIQNSMSDPCASKATDEIESEIKNYIGNDFKFCYPLVGQNYSTNIKYKFDSIDYMIVFCRTEENIPKSHTLFFEKTDEHWKIKQDIVEGNFEVTGSNINDINKDGFDEIILEGIDLSTLRPKVYTYQIQKSGIMQI